MSELLCKNCKHAFRSLGSIFIWGSGVEWRCKQAYKPASTEFDPVLGPRKKEAYYERCATARGSWSNSVCGAEGRLWSPKSKKFLFLQIKHSERS